MVTARRAHVIRTVASLTAPSARVNNPATFRFGNVALKTPRTGNLPGAGPWLARYPNATPILTARRESVNNRPTFRFGNVPT